MSDLPAPHLLDLQADIESLEEELKVARKRYEIAVRTEAEKHGYVLDQKSKHIFRLRKPKSKQEAIIGPLEVVSRFITPDKKGE